MSPKPLSKSSAKIHSTAIVDSSACLSDSVEVGPYCIVGKDAELHDNVILKSHVVIDCKVSVGSGTTIFPFASLQPPQDLKYKGEASELIIGKNNIIREHVTLNTGTEGGGMITRIGDDCLFMVGSHVAHDCHIGNNVVLVNNATLAGHVTVEDFAIIGGLSAVLQFVRIGAHAMVGGMSGVEKDVIPYGLVRGNRARLTGLNVIGLKRRGATKDEIHNLREAYNNLFMNKSTVFNQRLQEVEAEFGDSKIVQSVLEFIRAESKQGLCHPASDHEHDTDEG